MNHPYPEDVGAAGGRRVAVRPMVERDLDLVEGWLVEPHVARWWLAHSTQAAEFEPIRACVRGEDHSSTHMLAVTEDGRPVGWAQWYRWWDDDPADAAAMAAEPDEVGIDYAIGDRTAVGRGVGTAMIAALVRHVRRHYPESGILVGPDAENLPSRAVLARNGFELVEVRPVDTEPTDEPMAIYRLRARPVRLATVDDAVAIGHLLDQFNREYDESTPGPEVLSTRITELMGSGDTDVVVVGTVGAPLQGLAVLRFRPALWSAGSECTLAELYIAPPQRGLGLGRTLMEGALRHARQRGADSMDIGVDEPDIPARRLYESLGFTNRSGGPDGPLIFVYERDL